jgi:hypothetical protein
LIWPTLALTLYPLPRIRVRVRAFVGDSTMISVPFCPEAFSGEEFFLTVLGVPVDRAAPTPFRGPLTVFGRSVPGTFSAGALGVDAAF